MKHAVRQVLGCFMRKYLMGGGVRNERIWRYYQRSYRTTTVKVP